MSDKQTPVIIENLDENPNTQAQKDEQSLDAKQKNKHADKVKPRTSLLAWINLIFIIILFVLLGLVAWYVLNNQQNSSIDLALAKNQLQVLEADNQNLKSQINQFKQRAESVDSNIQALQKTMEFNSARLAKLPGAERQDWLLAEAEYLLRVANQRLQLEKDWQGTLGLLNAADKVLLETRNPSVNPIRRTISQELLALKETPAIDKVGMVLRLQSIQNRIPNLPWLPEKFIADTPQKTDDALANAPLVDKVWYKKAWHSLKQSLASMVRIRERSAPAAPALNPNQRYYLQQNMQLMLEQAQISALRAETLLYKQSINRVENWIEQYIVLENATTKAIQSSLKEMKSLNVEPNVPDISKSLKQLQDLVIQQRRAPTIKQAPAISNGGDDA